MSGRSIAPYFPWRRMKVAYQSVPEGSRSALVRLEPDERYRPLAKLGHANTRVTMDFYNRVTDANERAAAAAMDRLFDPSRTRKDAV